MAKSATDILQEAINAAVVDAIVALKEASQGLPNVLLRDLNAIHSNTAFEDLPPAVRTAVSASVRNAFSRLQKDGYVIAEAKSILTPTQRPAPSRTDHPAPRPRRGPPSPERPGVRHPAAASADRIRQARKPRDQRVATERPVAANPRHAASNFVSPSWSRSESETFAANSDLSIDPPAPPLHNRAQAAWATY